MSEVDRKPSILFVDDEEDVLAGIRGSLRKRRKEWDLQFAVGAAAALEIVERDPLDLVITDMRMPGMDGASLLARVRDLQPRAIRMVLSGHADESATLRAVAITQQWLAKPCERDQLIASIQSALMARRLIGDVANGQAIGGFSSLPSTPAILEELRTLVADPRCQIEDLVGVIERDPAISARILQVTNSAFFGLAETISDLAQAIPRLGLDSVSALVASEAVFTTASERGVDPAEVEAIRSHSTRCARVACAIARELPKNADVLPSAAFTGGLLHDVGRLLLAGDDAGDLEPAAIGAGLLAAWGLPIALVDAVARHRDLRAIDGAAGPLAIGLFVAHQLIARPQQPTTVEVEGDDRAEEPSAMILELLRGLGRDFAPESLRALVSNTDPARAGQEAT